MFETFETMVAEALAHSNSRETERINKEICIINARGWKDYIVFAANLFEEFRNKENFKADMGGSIFDSYLFQKSLDPTGEDNGFLSDSKSLSYFSNDALRLSLNFTRPNCALLFFPDPVKKDKNTRIDFGNMLEHNIKMSNSSNTGHQLFCTAVSGNIKVISNRELTEEEKTVILNEKKDSTAAETEILRKYLIIKTNHRTGI